MRRSSQNPCQAKCSARCLSNATWRARQENRLHVTHFPPLIASICTRSGPLLLRPGNDCRGMMAAGLSETGDDHLYGKRKRMDALIFRAGKKGGRAKSFLIPFYESHRPAVWCGTGLPVTLNKIARALFIPRSVTRGRSISQIDI